MLTDSIQMELGSPPDRSSEPTQAFVQSVGQGQMHPGGPAQSCFPEPGKPPATCSTLPQEAWETWQERVGSTSHMSFYFLPIVLRQQFQQPYLVL